MGIYSARKDLYETKRELHLSKFRKREGVISIGIDGEQVTGMGRDLHLEGDDLVHYVRSTAIDPYLRHGINVFMVFGGKPIKSKNDIKEHRINDKLKWQKSVFKSYTNQDYSKVKEDILNFVWNKVICYFQEHPPPECHPLHELYMATFVKQQPGLVMNSENYEYYMREVGRYVWSTNDQILKLFDKFIVFKQNVTLDDLPRDILWELSFNHWNGKMAQKRLVEHVSYVKSQLKPIVPIVDATYDGDDQLAMMVELGIIHAVVSGDSDFFAFNSNIVIVDIDPLRDIVSYVNLTDMYDNFEEKGFSEDMVRNAMIMSTADYNPEFYKYRIPFRESLKACTTIKGKKRSYHEMFEYFCNKYNKFYDRKIADEISHAYSISTGYDDVADAINVVVNSVVDYIYYSETTHNLETTLYLYVIKILLLSAITNNNNILNTKTINYQLNIYKEQTFSSIKTFTRLQQLGR